MTQLAFENLKRAMIMPCVDFTKDFVVENDASWLGIVAILV